MTRTSRLARRSIAVVEHVPTQLNLGLLWDHPIDRSPTGQPAPEPTPVAVPLRKRVAA